MRAGLLNERVSFFRTGKTHDGFTITSGRQLVATKWAAVKYERGRNALSSYALTQTQNLLVTIRIDNIDESMEMEHNGSVYKLTKPIIDRREGTMQFVAEHIEDGV